MGRSNYQIYCASYRRADVATTHKYLKKVTFVVDEKDGEKYKKIHKKVIVVPSGIQGNLARVWNWILDNHKGPRVVLIDDDIEFFGRWNGNEDVILEEDGVYNMIQEGYQLAEDLGVRYWGVNCLKDKGAYREYTPFGTKHYIGGPFQAHHKNECRYDLDMLLKEDYDMTLQVLKKYRKNLRMNMFHYVCKQANLKGGCAMYRSVDKEMEQNAALQKKWGSEIVQFDKSNKTKGKEKKFDINPIIKVPIKGV